MSADSLSFSTSLHKSVHCAFVCVCVCARIYILHACRSICLSRRESSSELWKNLVRLCEATIHHLIIHLWEKTYKHTCNFLFKHPIIWLHCLSSVLLSMLLNSLTAEGLYGLSKAVMTVLNKVLDYYCLKMFDSDEMRSIFLCLKQSKNCSNLHFGNWFV